MDKTDNFFYDGGNMTNRRSESIDITINENEKEKEDNAEKIHELLKEFEKIECEKVTNYENNLFFSEIYNYDINYGVRELGFIYEYYYGSKKTKSKKIDLITGIVLFETNLENFEKVAKRRRLWQCIEELKTDKYMKRFLIWG
jgi:hypothetical protein